ncbi:MAG: hypothetical protein V7742_18690 [Halioglobus sp.]
MSIWPPIIDGNPSKGMSDPALRYLCGPDLTSFDISQGISPLPPLYWTTEHYSFGKCYRSWLDWPEILPIPVYGDHGVCTHAKLFPHEVNNRSQHHLTWTRERFEQAKKSSDKLLLRIQHPWIIYRHQAGIKLNDRAKGTLVFISHSTPDIDIVGSDYAKYFEDLQSLEDSYHPLVYCLHMHEINKGLHHKLLDRGLTVVTAGKVDSPFFVDRFYDIISKFEFATSNFGGSELFYCHELGLKYFIRGAPPTYINKADVNLTIGQLFLGLDDLQIRKLALFSIFPPEKSAEKDKFVASVLGLDESTAAGRENLTKIFRKAVWRHPLFVVYRVAIATLYKFFGVSRIFRLLRR